MARTFVFIHKSLNLASCNPTFLVNLLQHKHFYTIETSLTFVYSRQHSQFLHLMLQDSYFFLLSCLYLLLILWIPSARLFTKFSNELVINLMLSINFNLQDMIFVISSPILTIFLNFFLLKLKILCIFQYFLVNK